jgi:multiple sugar transport system substrate-binding protein
MKAYGTTPWNEEGTRSLLDSPEAVAAVKLYHNMVFADGSAVPPGNQSDYFAGQAASTISQISHARKLADVDFGWDIAPLPGGPAGDVYLIGQAAIVAFHASRHRDEVIDFIAHMTNRENVTKMTVFFPPARKSVLDSPAFLQSNPQISPTSMQVVVDGSKNGTILSAHANFPKIRLAARGVFDKLWTPGADVAAVLAEASKAIEPYLNK